MASSSIDPADVRRVDDLDAAAGVGAAEPRPPGDDPPPEPSPAYSATGPLPFDAWFAMMHGAFALASAVTRLKSLAFDKAQPTAAPAFQAFYDTCAEIPALNFLIAPQGKWLGRIGAVAAFALPMGQGVRAELLERRGKASPGSRGDASPAAAAGAIPGVPSAAFYANLKAAEGAPAAASPMQPAEAGANQ